MSRRLLPGLAAACLFASQGPVVGASFTMGAGIAFEQAVRLHTRSNGVFIGQLVDRGRTDTNGSAAVTFGKSNAVTVGDLRDQVVNVLPENYVLGPGVASLRASCTTKLALGAGDATTPVRGDRNGTIYVDIDMLLAKGVLVDGKARSSSSFDISIVYQ